VPCDASSPAGTGRPLRLAYADPPYPGLARKYYEGEDTYRGEVDHPALIRSLVDEYDGWALSTGAYALRDLLPLCPPEVRVCAWCKPIGVPPATYGLHSTWEPLLVVPGRRLRPGKRDWLRAAPARLHGTLPGDELVDLFPGTGMVGRAWGELARPGVRREVLDDASRRSSRNDASRAAAEGDG
jgi:hypothetical protein